MAPRFQEMIASYYEMNSWCNTLNAILCLSFAIGVLLILVYCSNYLQLQCVYIDVSKGYQQAILYDESTEKHLLKEASSDSENDLDVWHPQPPPLPPLHLQLQPR